MVELQKIKSADAVTSILPKEMPELINRNEQGFIVVFRQDQIGEGNRKTGSVLLRPYLEALAALPLPPQAILLYNTAVRMAAEGHECGGLLKTLQDKGCELLICNLSLKQLGLAGKLAVGENSTQEIMLDRQLKADKILWP